MRLASFRIQNFKSIIDTGYVKLSVDDNITILAGQNESGKSAILEALNFFENGDETDFEEKYRRNGTSPRIECKYLLSDAELDKIEELNGAEIRRYLNKNGFIFVRGDANQDDFDQIKYINSSELKKLADEHNAQEEEAASKVSFSYLFDNRPTFIFYSSFSNSVLPNKITKSEIASNQAVLDFEKVFDIDFSELLSAKSETIMQSKLLTIKDKASDNLNEYWSQVLDDDEKAPYKYEIRPNINELTPQTSTISFVIHQNDGTPLFFSQKSAGFQWFTGFHLRLQAHNVSSGNFKNFILLIDEPGQSLHEEAQKDAKIVLNKLASDGAQIIFSTHQPQMLRDGEDIDMSRIKLVVKSKEEGTRIKNVAQYSSQGGFRDALSPIRTAMGLITLDASSLVDKRKVVVSEGITDYYYLEGIMCLYNINDACIIPGTGVSQVKNIFAILRGWGLSPSMIVDGDSHGSKAVNDITAGFFFDSNDAEVSKYVYKNDGCNGIEDTFSKTDFTAIAGGYIDPDDDKANSQRAKGSGSKEIIGRLFFDKAKNGELKKTSLDKESIKRIDKIVDFLKK